MKNFVVIAGLSNGVNVEVVKAKSLAALKKRLLDDNDGEGVFLDPEEYPDSEYWPEGPCYLIVEGNVRA